MTAINSCTCPHCQKEIYECDQCGETYASEEEADECCQEVN